jgi:LPPG:FO 2-phospho-L-lactate transferase
MKVVALSGGVGGARLVDGLAAELAADELTVVVNTGDDFRHCGLWICPDLDTVMYTLSGRAPIERGWGLAEESYTAMDGLKALGGADWFALSDQDLATHLMRSHRLDEGGSLAQISTELMLAHGIEQTILPMCDAAHPTMLETGDGTLDFQQWFVAMRAQPKVQNVIIPQGGIGLPEAVEAIQSADLIVVTPSNPYLSIDPILSLRSLRQALENRRCPCVGISPIVGGRAIKGPLGGLIESLAGRPASAAAVADHYGGLVDGWIIESGDQEGIDLPWLGTTTIMHDRGSRKQLADTVLRWAQTLSSRP